MTRNGPFDGMTLTPERIGDVDRVEVTVGMWNVIVWNDPVNLMSYVVWVFRKLFGYPEEKATRLMLDVHHKGRAVVAAAPREKAEVVVFQLHHHGLWATMEQG